MFSAMQDRIGIEQQESAHAANGSIASGEAHEPTPGLLGGVFVVGLKGPWYHGSLLAIGKCTPEGARWAAPPLPPPPVSPLP
jgi:hypothetical protein